MKGEAKSSSDMNADSVWSLFIETGDPYFYLIYKESSQEDTEKCEI